mmetsp:Transcript_27850/g.89421  ORF Transcript_27850/g.89421 Transcript_27850/m.89421 type:complete len:203 (-) Transcript_27850:157-765(-)
MRGADYPQVSGEAKPNFEEARRGKESAESGLQVGGARGRGGERRQVEQPRLAAAAQLQPLHAQAASATARAANPLGVDPEASEAVAGEDDGEHLCQPLFAVHHVHPRRRQPKGGGGGGGGIGGGRRLRLAPSSGRPERPYQIFCPHRLRTRALLGGRRLAELVRNFALEPVPQSALDRDRPQATLREALGGGAQQRPPLLGR